MVDEKMEDARLTDLLRTQNQVRYMANDARTQNEPNADFLQHWLVMITDEIQAIHTARRARLKAKIPMSEDQRMKTLATAKKTQLL